VHLPPAETPVTGLLRPFSLLHPVERAAAGPPVKQNIVEKVPLDEGDKEGTLKPRRNKGKLMSA
jgi:hypothetical protein